MKIGILKTKVEKILVESMSNNSFKNEIKNFKTIVLEDKNIAKAFYLYDILERKTELTNQDADLFINECIRQFEKLDLSTKKLKTIEDWTKNVLVNENTYKLIDTIFDDSVEIDTILESKKEIIKKITAKNSKTTTPNIPLSKIYEIAESTTKEYLTNLSENELKTLNKYLTLSESEINSKYELLSEMTIEKLNSLADNSDVQTKEKINETIERIETESKNQINLMKLRQLFNSL